MFVRERDYLSFCFEMYLVSGSPKHNVCVCVRVRVYDTWQSMTKCKVPTLAQTLDKTWLNFNQNTFGILHETKHVQTSPILLLLAF